MAGGTALSDSAGIVPVQTEHRHLAAPLHQVVGKAGDAADDGLDFFLILQFIETFVQGVRNDVAKLVDVVGSGVVNEEDRVGKVVVNPLSFYRFLKLCDCKVAEPVDLVFDCHGECLGMLSHADSKHGHSRWRVRDVGRVVGRCTLLAFLLFAARAGPVVVVVEASLLVNFGFRVNVWREIGSAEVVEVVEVLDHQFDDLWVVACVVSLVGSLIIALDCFELDGARFSLL